MTGAHKPAPGSRQTERQKGLDLARAWRAKNKPVFDAMYGAASHRPCGAGK